MTPKSRAQLAKMLGTFAAVDGPDRFDVGALDHETERMSLREDWTRSQVWKAAGWIAARNTTGSSIYVRPARALEEHPWILVDDLTAAALEDVKAKHPPGIIVETSPGSFQAWIRVQNPIAVEIRTSIARTLAQSYGGDPGGVGGNQFGRLPGTTNRKPSRKLANGNAPFAALRHAGIEITHVLIPTSDKIETTTRPPPGAAGESKPEHHGAQSRRDFAMACRLIEVGRHDEEIARAIAEVRRLLGDPKADRADYLDRTIRAAHAHIGRKKVLTRC